MFCGLPVIVATLPMFEPVASASSRGTGERRRRATSMTIGVNTRQIVSLTNSAESTPAAATTTANEQRRVRDARRDFCRATQTEEARQPQVRDQHHHPEQQDDACGSRCQRRRRRTADRRR